MGAIGRIVGRITGASSAADAASSAASTQAAAAQAGIDEQRRQFDQITQLMAPFVAGGTDAFRRQQALLGLSGAAAQQDVLSSIQSSPTYETLLREGEQALLQNASATGGLRGGNLQSALMEYRPKLLSQLIESEYAKLGGLAGAGQAAAAGQGQFGAATAGNIGNLLQQQGAATAGGQIAQGGLARQGFTDLLNIGSAIGGFF